MEAEAWIVTLPACGTEPCYRSTCTLIVQKFIQDCYTSGDKDGSVILTKQCCILYCNWIDSKGRPQKREFTATYTIGIPGQMQNVDLANGDFILDDSLCGRGLGSWIMQQLVDWAKTLPPDTSVATIKTSIKDEDDPVNHLRRDKLWARVGFQFPPGSRRSQAMYVSDLRASERTTGSLQVTALSEGVDTLVRQCDKLHSDVEWLKTRYKYQVEWNCYLEERQWDRLLLKGLFKVLLFLPNLIDYVYQKLSGKTHHNSQSR